ncbi:carboxypeptidase regulatory-like domain-containing protein [Pigmentiphaga soli]|uniref:Carboxypeptidase regulatory-like domain-containing protein n=1 Tax=Pigmentiphaga soli TaxID=1007095 RepID=A0ABP8H4V2_9BURK
MRFPALPPGRLLAAALSLALCAGVARADDPAPVPERSSNGISYVTGGVGADESAYLRSIMPRYSLRILAAASSGAFQSNVKVAIRDERGTPVLSVTTEGPYLLVALKPGRYQVAAEADGASQAKAVQVPAKGHADVSFYWPDRNGG